MSKKINKMLLIILMMFCGFFVACKSNEEEPKHHESYESNIPSEFEGILKTKKLYITSIGQSFDMGNFMYYLEYLKEEYNFEYVDDSMLLANEVEDGAIVFIFVGCSIKAMQESGLTIDSEMARARDFLKKKEEGKITIVTWHTGGNARRGATSDDLIKNVVKGSDLFIFVKTGNEDMFLSDTAVNNNIPLYEIDSASQVRAPLIIMLGSR